MSAKFVRFKFGRKEDSKEGDILLNVNEIRHIEPYKNVCLVRFVRHGNEETLYAHLPFDELCKQITIE